MSILGNILWLIFGGLELALGYFIGGIVLCLTIVGIPFGFQAFKIGVFALLPFGQTTAVHPGGIGCLSTLFNVLWIITFGVCLALGHLLIGLLLCITVIGIPFGLQHFKLAGIALTPFGRTVVSL
jgi:uncharacterized membrane protein YccF (DUF307 family)